LVAGDRDAMKIRRAAAITQMVSGAWPLQRGADGEVAGLIVRTVVS
jgi:hypothetical protein